MGKGIVVEFNKRFDMKNKLVRKYGNRLDEWDKTTVENVFLKIVCLILLRNEITGINQLMIH